MRAYQRLLEYVKYGTASSETTGTTPSTPGQKVLGTALKIELESLGIPAECDENGYVYAQIPATEGCGDVPAVGFIAHMDTSPECSGDNVVPRITENYGGCDLDLGHGTVRPRFGFSAPCGTSRQDAYDRLRRYSSRCRRQGGGRRDNDPCREADKRKPSARKDLHRLHSRRGDRRGSRPL